MMITTDILFYEFIAISVIPAFYLAINKRFIYVVNRKYNFFIIRLIFTAPFSFLINIFSYVLALIWETNAENEPIFLFETFGIYTYLLAPITIVIIFLILMEIFVLPRDDPPEWHEEFKKNKKNEHVFYFFKPPSKLTGYTKYKTNRDEKSNLPIPKQIKNLTIDPKIIEGDEISFTTNGEFIITENALEILNENNITNFCTRPVEKKDMGLFEFLKKEYPTKYFQIICTSILEPLSEQTNIQRGKWPTSVLVSHDIHYYNKRVLETSSDINQTQEYFGSEYGSPYFVQRHWIVSKKVRDIFINEFGQDEKFFTPVLIVDDFGNLVEPQKNEHKKCIHETESVVKSV